MTGQHYVIELRNAVELTMPPNADIWQVLAFVSRYDLLCRPRTVHATIGARSGYARVHA